MPNYGGRQRPTHRSAADLFGSILDSDAAPPARPARSPFDDLVAESLLWTSYSMRMAIADESNPSTPDTDSVGQDSDSVDVSGCSCEGHVDLIVAEYVSLRSEILKLIELQSQLVSLAVVTVGAILGVAVQTADSSLAFVYPLLALILGLMWLNHSHSISRCAAYLSQDLEPRFGAGVLGWENFVRRNPLRYGMLGYWGVRSVFMGSSMAAVLGGWTLLRDGVVPIMVGAISSLVTAVTIALFLVWREPSPRMLLEEKSG